MKKILALLITLLLTLTIGVIIMNNSIEYVKAEEDPVDTDDDGRPDDFEIANYMNPEENDVEWTFLVYMCLDDVPLGTPSSLTNEAWEIIERMSWVGCTDNINIVVQFDGTSQMNWANQDGSWGSLQNSQGAFAHTTRRFLVGNDTSKSWDYNNICNPANTVQTCYDVTNWPINDPRAHNTPNWEANMGDPDVLEEFIDWGMDTFDSENYCLYIYSHGEASNGTCYDYNPSGTTLLTKDLLKMDEVAQIGTNLAAMTPPKKLDIVNLYSCFMGCIEFQTEFGSFCDWFVGSEDSMSAYGNEDNIVFNNVDCNPNWGPQTVASDFVTNLYNCSRDGLSQLPQSPNKPQYIPDWPSPSPLDNPFTYASINCGHLDTNDIIGEFEDLSLAIQSGVSGSKKTYFENSLIGAVNNAVHFPQSGIFDYRTMDIYHFVDYFTSLTGIIDNDWFALVGAASNIKTILLNSPNSAGIDKFENDTSYYSNAEGLSVTVFDDQGSYSRSSSQYSDGTFEGDSAWGHVLQCLYTAGWTYTPI